jgi:hypothetical protein
MPSGHPNTIASLVTGGLAYAIYRVSTHYDWLHVSSDNAMLIATAIIAGVLFVGRRGVWPTLKSIWFGAQKAATGTPPAE